MSGSGFPRVQLNAKQIMGFLHVALFRMLVRPAASSGGRGLSKVKLGRKTPKSICHSCCTPSAGSQIFVPADIPLGEHTLKADEEGIKGYRYRYSLMPNFSSGPTGHHPSGRNCQEPITCSPPASNIFLHVVRKPFLENVSP